jgi:hypothetical protein
MTELILEEWARCKKDRIEKAVRSSGQPEVQFVYVVYRGLSRQYLLDSKNPKQV